MRRVVHSETASEQDFQAGWDGVVGNVTASRSGEARGGEMGWMLSDDPAARTAAAARRRRR